MWVYETWVYQNIINTEWFMWGIVGAVFVFIFLSPVLIFICLLEKEINVSKIMKQLKNKSKNETSGSS